MLKTLGEEAASGHRAGVLESSFVSEIRLMGEQTICAYAAGRFLCLCFDKLPVAEGTDPAYAEKLIQFGWEANHRSADGGRHP